MIRGDSLNQGITKMNKSSDIVFMQRSSVPRRGMIFVTLVFKDGSFTSGWIKPGTDIHGRYRLLTDDLDTFLAQPRNAQGRFIKAEIHSTIPEPTKTTEN